MRLAPDRVVDSGVILVVDDVVLTVSDILSQEIVEVKPGTHVLTLGGTTVVNGLLMWEFCLMEEGRIVVVDDADAAILELSSTEIA